MGKLWIAVLVGVLLLAGGFFFFQRQRVTLKPAVLTPPVVNNIVNNKPVAKPTESSQSSLTAGEDLDAELKQLDQMIQSNEGSGLDKDTLSDLTQ